MIRSIIIDDEQAARDSLSHYIGKYCPDVKVEATAQNINEALELIASKKPQLLFLDVEMPFGNAFDLLEKFEDFDFQIIFVTAFSQYAIQALNLSAAYYLMKPVDIDELIMAVERAKQNIENKEGNLQARVLVENFKAKQMQEQKVVLPLIDGFEVVPMKDVIRCQANDNFTDFHLSNGESRLICRTLKFYDELLSPFDFLRVHKSHLINLQYVTRYKKGKGGQVYLSDGSVVDVSAGKKATLLERF